MRTRRGTDGIIYYEGILYDALGGVVNLNTKENVPILIASKAVDVRGTPLLAWFTYDSNQAKLKAALSAWQSVTGSSILIQTSDNYVTGLGSVWAFGAQGMVLPAINASIFSNGIGFNGLPITGNYTELRLWESGTGNCILDQTYGAGYIDFRRGGVSLLKLLAAGLSIGDAAHGTNAALVVALKNGVAPTTSGVDSVQFYAEDVNSSSMLKVREESGNVAILTDLVISNIQTGNYTAVLADKSKVIEMNVAGANTFTIPPNSSVAFPVGTILEVYQMGAGQTTITAGAGVTFRAPSGAKTAVQYATASVRKRATDEWVVSGHLTT